MIGVQIHNLSGDRHWLHRWLLIMTAPQKFNSIDLSIKTQHNTIYYIFTYQIYSEITNILLT